MQSSALMLDPFAPDSPDIAVAISRSIEDVSSLLDSLLDISKLDAGTLTADQRPIQLSRMVESWGRSMGPLVQAKGLLFEFSCPPGMIVRTDPLLLERVVRNLIDNAIKFTEHGRVQLMLTFQHQTLRLTVRDSGAGIAPAQQALVFEEFYQVDQRAQARTRGLGLGLSIVSRLVQLLGMQLALESEPGQGTAVVLTFPADAMLPVTRPPLVAAAALPSPMLNGLRVMVLDDDEAIRLGLGTLLRRMGCEVEVVSTVAQALAAAPDFEPDVLLADCQLRGGASGLDAVALLRAGYPSLRALLISGDTSVQVQALAHAQGLPLLHKPVTLAQLKHALSALAPQAPQSSSP
jgi:two-component system, sensor histidine kinase